jgi:hypothetical protein
MLSLFCISISVNAQSDKKYQKTMAKVYKAKTKELKKQKWQVSGTSLTLDAAIMKHLRTLNSNENCEELIVNVSMCQSLNVCKATALNNALIEYANGAASYKDEKSYLSCVPAVCITFELRLCLCAIGQIALGGGSISTQEQCFRLPRFPWRRPFA